MINAIRISSSYFLVIIFCITAFSSGCKKVPSVSIDNEHDPESELYQPPPPSKFELSIHDEGISLSWQQSRETLSFIDGYKIKKSVTDTNSFDQIGLIPSNSYDRRYNFEDKERYNGVNVLYKIQSFYIQREDTAFSNPQIISKSFSDENQSFYTTIQPFATIPTVKFQWFSDNVNPDIKVEHYSKNPDQDDYQLLGTSPIGNESAEYELDISQPEETNYYYRVTLESISSSMEKIEYELSMPVLELKMDAEQIQENSAVVELGFSSEFTSYDATLENFTLRLFESKNPIEITAFGEADTTLAYKTIVQFDPPTTSLSLNDLNPSKYYIVTVSGHRGSFDTHEEFKYLTFNFVNTLSKTFSNNLYEDSDFQGSFDSNSQRVLYSFDGSTVGVMNTNNGQIDNSFYLNARNDEPGFISTAFAEFDGVQDAIITSTSSDKVQIWDPNTYNLVKDIPNYSENFVETSPWDFTVISTNKLLIAYLPENYETKRAIFITIWDQTKEEHELVYKINQDIIYPQQTKLVYNQDHNLIHILQSSISQEDYNRGEYPNLKLLSIDSNNYELLSNVEIKNLGQGSVENMISDNSGDYLYIFNEGGYTQFDVQNLEQNYTRYFRYLKSLISAKDSSFKCLGGNSSNETDIQCFWKGFDSSPLLFEHESDNYILGLIVNDSGTRLAVIYQHAFQFFDFTKSWRLDN